MLTNARFHRRSDSQRLVNPGEIVVHVEQRHLVHMVIDLFAESICQARESSHTHPHGEILSLNITRGDVLRIGIAQDSLRDCAKTLRRAVALLSFRIVAVKLHKLRVVDLIRKSIDDGVQIHLVAVRRQLDSIRQAFLNVLNKLCRRPGVPPSNQPTNHQFALSFNGDERPNITTNASLGYFLRDVLLLRPNKTPDLIYLNPPGKGYCGALRSGIRRKLFRLPQAA